MDLLLTHFAATESAGPAALGISLQAFIVQLLTFLIVFLVLRKWAFKPIIKVLNERHDLIEQGVTLGEKMRADQAKLEADVTEKLADARRQADALLADAESEVRQKVAAAEDTAREHAAGIISDAETQIKQSAQRERARLEKEIVALVSEVSEAVIQEKVDAKKDASLIDKALKERRKP